MRVRWLLAIVIMLLASRGAFGESAPPPSRIELGGAALDGWSGLKPAAGGAAILAIPGEASFRYPDGPRGFHNHGFRLENDGAVDWTGFYGPHFEMCLADDREVELTVTLSAAAPNATDKGVVSVLRVAGAGWHGLTLPWSAFAFDQAGNSFLRFGKGCSIAARFTGGGAGSIQLRNMRIVLALRWLCWRAMCGANRRETRRPITKSGRAIAPTSRRRSRCPLSITAGR